MNLERLSETVAVELINHKRRTSGDYCHCLKTVTTQMISHSDTHRKYGVFNVFKTSL